MNLLNGLFTNGLSATARPLAADGMDLAKLRRNEHATTQMHNQLIKLWGRHRPRFLRIGHRPRVAAAYRLDALDGFIIR